MKKLLFISSIFLLSATSVLAQQEDSLKKQALDDVEALSSKNFPYIEKFHEAIREKLSGNYVEAKKLFLECLEVKDNDDAVYFGLGEIAKSENKISKALTYFQKAYKIDPENTIYLQELAYIQYERANFEAAELLFKEMTELEPRNVDFRYGYSKVLIYNKAYKLAIDQINILQNQTGVVPELMIMKADLYLELKDKEKAEETLLQLKDEYPENQEVLDKVIAFYKQQGEEAKAVKLIEGLAKADPNNASAKLEMAKSFLKEKKNSKFIEIAPKILESNKIDVKEKLFVFDKIQEIEGSTSPLLLESAKTMYDDHSTDFQVASNYIDILMFNQQTKKAVKLARKTTEDNPNNFEAWRLSLSVTSSFKDYNYLFEDGTKALERFPNQPLLYYATAEGALYSNHPDEAMELIAAGEIYLMGDKKKEALFSMRKGEVFFYNKEYKKGIIAFEKALSLSPENTNIKVIYANALTKAEIAKDVAKKMLNEIPTSEKKNLYYLTRAKQAANNKEFSEGIKILKKGLESTYNKAELYDYLGDLYFKSANNSKAIENWNLALTAESRNKNLTKKINEEKYYAPKYY